MKGIGVGKKAESLLSFQWTDDFGDFQVFPKDIVPDGDEFLEGEGELKMLF